MIAEGSAKIEASRGKISRSQEVFYNPVMKLNRDISILLLDSLPDKDLQIALPLAGSGIRGIRFLKELRSGKIRKLVMNDYKSSRQITANLKSNDVSCDVFSKDANIFLLEGKGFDYIDIDPFGTPNPFLDSAVQRLSRRGILAVTATDTAALAGSSSKAGMRKYYAKTMRNELMHEIGIRILIRKVQLIGGQYDKALLPVFSYSKDHYYRIFFRCSKGKTKVDSILEDHNYLLYDNETMEREVSKFNYKEGYDYTGPMWTGQLWNSNLAEKMFKNCDPENKKLGSILSIIKDESKIDAVGFYDIHKYAKMKSMDIPKIESLLSKDISRTHFLGWGVKTRSHFSLRTNNGSS